MKQHRQRASAAVKIAAAMAHFRCAVHHGETDWPDLHLDDVAVPDVIDALSRMLQMQIGQPVTVVTPTAEDAWVLAEQVAANADYDTEMFRSAALLGQGREQFWAASQAHKPEDDPDWK